MIHPKLFLDNKNLASGHAAQKLLDEIRKIAKKEEKIGVLTLTGGRKHGFVYCIHSDDVVRFLQALAEDMDFIQQAVCDETALSADTLYFGDSLQRLREKHPTVETIKDAVTVAKKRVRVVTQSGVRREQRRKVRLQKQKNRSRIRIQRAKEEALA